ncbi:MAG: bifunctional riboflavin kinase/FMN adenylyltransferase [Thermoguttaceae bacterium]
MELIYGLDNLPLSLRGCVATLGKFDAVHRGHAAILARVVNDARERGVAAVAVTFDPPPGHFLHPQRIVPPLCTLSRRLELLASHRLDATVVLATTPEFLVRTPQEFVASVLVDGLGVVAMVEGESFTFGVNQTGNAETLRELGRQTGFDVTVVPPVNEDGRPISASRLRKLIGGGERKRGESLHEESTGDVATARRMLGYPYRITGTVTRGLGRGRRLGFPTANFSEIETLLPAPGVYATLVTRGEKQYAAATHIGRTLTFGGTTTTVESFLIDFSGDLYGTRLDIDFIERIRDVVAFSSAEELVRQMKNDVGTARRVVPPPWQERISP